MTKQSKPRKEPKGRKESPRAPKEERKKYALGKDLAALLEDDLDIANVDIDTASVREVPVDKIFPNPAQPRRTFKAESIQELASSIKEQGLMQPIVLRPRQGTPDEYELVVGERRWRASTKAGLAQVPAIVRDLTDESSASLALIENIQREDLNPYEQAVAMEKLRARYNYTQQQLADVLSKARASVANLLRLLKLEQAVKDMLAGGFLELGHAKVLLSLEGQEQVKLAEEAVENGISVRELEKLLQSMQNKKGKRTRGRVDANVMSLQEELSDKLGVRVVFSHKKNGTGKMMIHYNSADELDGVLKTLKLKKTNP